jgi:hypothetical protein
MMLLNLLENPKNSQPSKSKNNQCMKRENFNFRDLEWSASDFFEDRAILLADYSDTTISNNSVSVSISPSDEIRELHKLLDELFPETSGMGTVAAKLRSILLEPKWTSVRAIK